MQVTVEIKPGLEAKVVAEAERRGVDVATLVEECVDERLQTGARSNGADDEREVIVRAAAAVKRMRELSRGVRLDGLKIKDLINEGRKY